jgi:hypothetical protein
MQRLNENKNFSGGCSLQVDLIELVCSHCEFYKEEEVKLECAAYKILRKLLQKGIITPREISDAVE